MPLVVLCDQYPDSLGTILIYATCNRNNADVTVKWWSFMKKKKDNKFRQVVLIFKRVLKVESIETIIRFKIGT